MAINHLPFWVWRPQKTEGTLKHDHPFSKKLNSVHDLNN